MLDLDALDHRPRRRPLACAVRARGSRGTHARLAEDERFLRPLALLALAIERLPAAGLLMPALALVGDDCDPALRDRARRLGAALVTTRALEFHARDADYRPGEWIAAGVVQTELAVEAESDCVELLDDAARAIGAAIVATEADLMAVPEQLSSALGAALALYERIADGAGS
jgi:hypothetical protein